MTSTVRVNLDSRSYDVVIGSGLIAQAATHLAPLLRRPKVWIVTEDRVAPLHLAHLEAALTAGGIAARALILPAGEGTKSWH